MPNYEELYYTAKRNYERTLNDLSYIRSTKQTLESRKSTLKANLPNKEQSLKTAKNNLRLMSKAENKCQNIINDEFPTAKSSIKTAGTEYKKIISTDKGVADINSIYSTDISDTKKDLDSILSELSRKRKTLEGKVESAQKDYDDCFNELNSVQSQLNNLGSEYWTQIKANNYYVQMQEYKRKWENQD